MNKLVRYLNQHLLGEVTGDESVRNHHSVDGSVLRLVPEIVAFPRETSDVRKIVNFSSQLANKGHQLPITARGAGTDTTGGSLGDGIVLGFTAHMNKVFEYDPKQKLVRLQPGVTLGELRNSLRLQGVAITALSDVTNSVTVGGAIASRYDAGDWVDKLEVVLSSGATLQTGRVSKRELSKKKAEKGLEGKIYRELDELIEENADLVAELADRPTAGYPALSNVKQRDGSFDLTPLFFGSQGTLGIVSELIAKADYVNDTDSVVVGAFRSLDDARDAIDLLRKLDTSSVELYDKSMVELAEAQGKEFELVNSVRKEDGFGALVMVRTSSISSRLRSKTIKKVTKAFTEKGAVTGFTDDMSTSPLRAYEAIPSLALQAVEQGNSLLPVIDGAYIPTGHLDVFFGGIAELAKKYGMKFGVYGRPADEYWWIRAELDASRVADRQTNLKLLQEFSVLVEKSKGSVAGLWSEGRTLAPAATQATDDRVLDLYRKIKNLFDPSGILNPGVKQTGEMKDLVRKLRTSYSAPESDGLSRF
ncbi:FAD-binding oxidoreductase [Candidatus Nomurabacteria bacterium]|nr:FAD-binding oxidoreductase [Candidatus Nomurabacteria bacterium]